MSISSVPVWCRRGLGLWAGGAVLLGSAGLCVAFWSSRQPPQLERREQAAQPAAEPSGPGALCLAALPVSSAHALRLERARAAARARPERAEVWIDLGRAWLRQAQSSGDAGYALNAQACADVALQLAPEHPTALALLAGVKLDAHEFARARELAEAALARDAEDAEALGTLSDAALELGDVAAATQAAQRLMDLDPGLPAYARASYLRWLYGQEGAAIELARHAIDAAGDPNEREARAWMLVQAAQLFWHRADVEGAELGYRMALGVQPSHSPALLGLGRAAASRGDWRAAADAFRRALDARPGVEAAALLGDALERMGDVAGAAQSYVRAEQLGRSDPRSLSYFYSVRGRQPQLALALARRERETRGDIYTEDALAWALYRNGEFADAALHSQRALGLGTRDAQLLYHRGAIQLALGERTAGRALIERALQQNPHFDPTGAAEARRLLEQG
jgi:tetratricopeptide (TPR) repeat protein